MFKIEDIHKGMALEFKDGRGVIVESVTITETGTSMVNGHVIDDNANTSITAPLDMFINYFYHS